MADDTMLALAAQIVSAHVAHNPISPADLPKLINDVGLCRTIVHAAKERTCRLRQAVR